MQPRPSTDLFLLAKEHLGGRATLGQRGRLVAAAQMCEHVLAGGGLLPERKTGRKRVKELQELMRQEEESAIEQVTDQLCATGVLGRKPGRFLLWKYEDLVIANEDAVRAAEARLSSALTPGAVPDAGQAVLAILCRLGGIGTGLVPASHGDKVALKRERTVLAAHIDSLRPVVGPDVAEVLDAAAQLSLRRPNTTSAWGDLSFPVRDSDWGGDGGGGSDGGGGDGGGGGGGGGD